MVVGRRQQQVEQLVREKNRLRESASAIVCREIQVSINWLTARVGRVDRSLQGMIEGDEALRSRCDLLLCVPGVGPQLALTLTTNLPELGTLNRRTIAALAGVAP